MEMRSRLAPWVAVLACLLAAGAASANGYLSAQVGGFAPWHGDAGVMTTLQILGSGASGRSRWGGEFEYRGYERDIRGVHDVDASSYVLRGMWQYHLWPEALVTPYFGLGLGVTINSIDDDKVDDARGFNAVDAVGAGLDGVFLLGVSMNIPRAEYVSVFAEGRVGLAFDARGEGSSNDVQVDNVGGASGSVGVRFRF